MTYNQISFMKTIGIIGGTSWYSTAEYYRLINTEVQKRLGGLSSAKLLVWSFNFEEIVSLQRQDKWDEVEKHIIHAGLRLENAGAQFLLFGANTMHRFTTNFCEKVKTPLIHIADVTAQAIQQAQMRKVILIGTKPTMQLDFYKTKLSTHNIDCVVPGNNDQEAIHSIIYDELTAGKILPSSKAKLLRIIESLKFTGATGVILGCTELPLMIQSGDTSLHLFNTTEIHSLAAVDRILQ